MFVICDCSCVCCCSSFAFSQWTLHRCHLSLRTCPALYLGDLSASLALLAPLLNSFNLDGSSAAPPLSINCLLPCFYIVSFSVSLLCPRLDRSRREVFVETRRWIFPHHWLWSWIDDNNGWWFFIYCSSAQPPCSPPLRLHQKYRFYMAKQSKMYMTHDKVASKV